VMPQPYSIVSTPVASSKNLASRTTHGSPHTYDTHVPLVVMGPGVVPGVRGERVLPQALVAILAEALDLPPPGGAIAAVPDGVFTKR